MKKFVYKLSLLVAFVSLLLNIFSGIPLHTSVFRTLTVYFGTLVVIIAALNLMRWGLLITSEKKPVMDLKKKDR